MAQLDSASDSDSDGWRFKSVWVRHLRSLPSRQRPFFYFQTDSYLSLTRLMPCIAIAITLTSFPTSPPGCTTLTPQPCVVGFSLPSCVLVPFADAIATACNNRYYIHFVLYKSPGCTTLTPQPCVVGFLFFLCRIAPYSRQQQTVACFQNLAMVYLSCKEIK